MRLKKGAKSMERKNNIWGEIYGISKESFELLKEDLEQVFNIVKWQNRLHDLMNEANSIPTDDTSSMHVRNKEYWNNFEKIDIGKVVSWIFIHEESGLRMKA